MDAFFASVELLRYPELRGLPVVIAGRAEPPPLLPDGTRRYQRLRDYVGRGVITTSTYEARKLGVFSAMGAMKAAQLAPEAILLPVDFAAYRYYSRLFKEAVAAVAPCIEDRGIDEIYIDLTDDPRSDHEAAVQIKEAVKTATGLTCSIAISPNKLLSKIGSDLEKPDGLTLLSLDDVPDRIWPLSVRKINGIGPKASEKLARLGIETVGQLARSTPALLQSHFGRSYARWLLQVAQGFDDRPVVTRSDPKSISRETTFERDLHVVRDRAVLSEVFARLCEQVSSDLKRKGGYVGRTIGIKLRFDDFRTVTRDITLPEPVQDVAAIRKAAGQCLKRVSMERRIRLLGVRVTGLQVYETGGSHTGSFPQQLSLY